MRIDFFKALMEKGFVECGSCGKILSASNSINGACADCMKDKKA
ncbi:MAG: hypothetical protein WC307_03645 [Candidatus Nanoarchaeia archaeon]|jgi:hypothetical protein